MAILKLLIRNAHRDKSLIGVKKTSGQRMFGSVDSFDEYGFVLRNDHCPDKVTYIVYGACSEVFLTKTKEVAE